MEIGVRIALGASRGDVLRLFQGEPAIGVLVGVMAGSAAALAGGRYMQSLLFGVSTRDAASVHRAEY